MPDTSAFAGVFVQLPPLDMFAALGEKCSAQITVQRHWFLNKGGRSHREFIDSVSGMPRIAGAHIEMLLWMLSLLSSSLLQ